MDVFQFLLDVGRAAGIDDGDIGRELVAAIVALAVFAATAPTHRRGLVWGPLLLLAASPLPLLVPVLFPGKPESLRIAALGVRWLLLASLLQSLLLVAVVSVWERVSQPLPRIFLDVLRWTTAALALLVILGEAGVGADRLFTGSAVVTAVLGFALRDTLGNVFAGLAIHAEGPFAPGDWIQYDANPAHVGRVTEINWRATKVITLDEAEVIIPNGQLAVASIRNFTKPTPWSRRSLFVTAPYGVSPQRVQRIILEALRGSFGVLEDPAPSVVTNAFTERGVEYWVRLFTTEFGSRDRVDGMARDRIWFALSRAGIEIPVATQQIRYSRQPAPPPETTVERADRLAGVLGRVPLFASLDGVELRSLAAAAVEQVFATGETVIRQGDPGTSMYVIEAGRVKVTAVLASGPATPLAELGPGDFFGEMSLVTGAARSATVTALVETRLIAIDVDALRPVVELRPEIAERLGAALADRESGRLEAVLEGGPQPPPVKPDLLQRIIDFLAS
jgi:small-conductance mechanosensitive channel/CRP-like cAMP-binding protein